LRKKKQEEEDEDEEEFISRFFQVCTTCPLVCGTCTVTPRARRRKGQGNIKTNEQNYESPQSTPEPAPVSARTAPAASNL
jgi:hypothetical protein